LVELAPGNIHFVQLAFAIQQQLGNATQIAVYAKHLLVLDDTHSEALRAMAQFCHQHCDARGEAEYRARLARFPASDENSVTRLHNIWEGLNAALLIPLDDHLRNLIAALKEAAATVPLATQAANELYAGWETHYRLTIEAVDFAALTDPISIAQPYPPIVFQTATGRELDSDALQELAAQVKAEVVFFVAADEAYLALYAQLYVSSVLKNCDVGCLVIVHAIGGVDRLGAIVASLELTDDRLVFSADAFDPAQAQGRCYRPPPVGWRGSAAHYQSARFQWLPFLLEQIGLPIFVSDIDLLLQRGVQDLLERCASADVTLNENSDSRSYSSRVTANLVLVQPSEAGQHFARVLSHYLTQALQKSEIHYMIDQCALLMARHYVSQISPFRFAYFDTNVDINNLMYKKFQENPFRFLSLYHGFDVSTLRK
jgi:hypothetical protein